VVERGTLPPGFSLTVYAEVAAPTSLRFGPDGRLYVANVGGNVFALLDDDGDHRAEGQRLYAGNLTVPLGMLWIDDTLYVSYRGAVQTLRDSDGDLRTDERRDIVTGLPSLGLHQNDALALGPDGWIYMGQGSTCDVCVEADPRSAGILRFQPDGSQLEVFATGLRNPVGVAFNAAGDLFATDNGRDDLGREAPLEEFNHIVAGADYGWPDCWLGAPASACGGVTQPIATFSARSSANGIAFYEDARWPVAYRGNAFVAVLGSYVYADLPRGVQRLRLTRAADGSYVAEADWFLDLTAAGGRPLDLTVGPDGALYVADYALGAVYRVTYGAP
jgi:glucose/arabinose dehydrogenase